MTYEMLIVLIALVCAIILFATELLRVDVVAVLIMATLMITGVLSPEEGLAGFSNGATATVAAMFVLSAAVESTGIMMPLAKRMEAAFQKGFWIGFFLMLILTGVLSAFVNNTPVVALLIPVVIAAASKAGISPSKVLIPLSFISMFGGVCTLVGTSTNILVSNVSEQYGFGAWGMFEMTGLGLIFFGAGALFMVFIGIRLLPDYGKTTDLNKEFHINEYLTNIELKKEALSGRQKLGEIPFLKEEDVEVVQISRGDAKYYLPGKEFVLMENDILKIKCNVERIKTLQARIGFDIKPLLTDELILHGQKELRYVEAIVSPGSSLEGKQFIDVDFRGAYHAALLGIRARNGLFKKLMKHQRVVSGDTLLFAIEQENISYLKRKIKDFILISEPELNRDNFKKGILAISIVALVILTASLKIFPILAAAIAGCILMVLTRCIDAESAYRSVNWKIIFLLAGTMSFGIALKKTGLADVIASSMISITDGYGPIVLLSAVYLLTSLLTEAMSNNATVILLAPIVIAMAETLGISSKPFLMAITFAASASFMSPIGYQTNTMVYAAGNYKFRDFFKVGVWLNILFWILATIFIPILFPF